MIIFEIGQNDSLYNKDFGKAWVKLEEFEKNVYELIDKAKKYTDKIIFLELPEVDESKTIPWEENGDSYSNENILRYNEKIKGICKKEKVIFLPTRDILKIAEDLHDGIHLNTQGHEKIFRRILPVVEKMIGKVEK